MSTAAARKIDLEFYFIKEFVDLGKDRIAPILGAPELG
jgi:hypothetical protein